MTVTIHLPSGIEADLVAQAREHGLELPQYVEHLLRGQVGPHADTALSPAERAAAWRESRSESCPGRSGSRAWPRTAPIRGASSPWAGWSARGHCPFTGRAGRRMA